MTKLKKIVFILSSIIVTVGCYYFIDQPKTIIAKNLETKIAIGPKTASVKAREKTKPKKEKTTEGQKNPLKENRTKIASVEAKDIVGDIVGAIVVAIVVAIVGIIVVAIAVAIVVILDMLLKGVL